MSDPVLIAIIMAFPGTISAYFSYRASVHSRENLDVSKQTQLQTDGMNQAMVELTKKSAHREGMIAGAEQERETPGSPPIAEP